MTSTDLQTAAPSRLADSVSAGLESWCDAVKLTGLEKEIVLAWVDGCPMSKLTQAFSLQRHQVKAQLHQAIAKFRRAGVVFGADEREFARDLLHCVANRPGENRKQTGVEPNRDILTRFPAARLVAADHAALCGSPLHWLANWAHGLS